jgi:uncharacterized membrane-anchored protein
LAWLCTGVSEKGGAVPDPVILGVDPHSPVDGFLTWIKDHERLVLLTAAAFQVIFLVAMIGLRVTPLLAGETILVRVVPVDPRDLFRGDYVILGYDFSRIPPAGIEGLADSDRQREQQWQGLTVYVSLVPELDGKHWRAERFSLSQPTSGKYLQGRITGPGRLEFGIEAYYLQEGQGSKYEEAMRDRRLAAEIAVTADGHAALRGLRIE